MEREQGVQHRQRSLANHELVLRRADGAEDLPLVDRLLRRLLPGGDLRRHMGKRQRSPPKGRRWMIDLHGFALNWAKDFRSPKRRWTLDSDVRKCDSRVALRREKGFRA